MNLFVSLALVTLTATTYAMDNVEPKPIRVEGIIHAGQVAIGGETTGVILETDSGKYELFAKPGTDLANRLKDLDGKRAAVEGRLTVKPGVEVSKRRIIEVEKVDSAAPKM